MLGYVIQLGCRALLIKVKRLWKRQLEFVSKTKKTEIKLQVKSQ